MQIFIFLLLTISLSFSSQIDTRLFKGENVDNYLKQIEKDINSTISKKLKTAQMISDEKATLEKLKKIYSVKDEIKPFKTAVFEKKSISQEKYLKAFYNISELKTEIQRLEEKELTIQQKLFEIKTVIEKTLKNSTEQSLLLNQMQYAFYKISQEKISKSLTIYRALFKNEFKNFKNALPHVVFKESSTKKILKNIDNKIDKLKNQNLLLEIDKDSEALRDEKTEKKLIKEEKSIQEKRDIITIKKLDAKILLALKWLKDKNEDKFLESLESIDDVLKTLSKERQQTFEVMLTLLMNFADKHFGSTTVALSMTELGLKNSTNELSHFFNKTLFIYQEKAFSIKTIFTFFFLIFIGFLIAKLYKNFIQKFRKSNRIKSLSTARMVANSGYYIIILITFFIALRTIGLNMHTIFLLLGALLVWIALGLQGFISNYAMGILMKIDRSIRIGDHIELDAQTIGRVDDMDFRSVVILTGDHTRVVIPNSRFINGSFINHSLEDPLKRLHITFSVNKSIDYHLVEKTILDDLDSSELVHIKTKDKRAKVIIIDINRKIVRYSLLVWVNYHNKYDMPVEKSHFFTLIHQSLKKIAL